MKKKLIYFLTLGMVFILAACSAAQPAQQAAAPADTPSQAGSGGGSGGGGGNGGNPQGRLAIGILQLEGTSNAVTADQAKKMLPLWQQVKTLSADTATNPADLQAVYTQIQAVLTSDQTSAMQTMTFDQTTMQNMMKQYNIQITPGAFGGGNGTPFPTQNADQMATRTVARQTQQAGGVMPNGTLGAFGGRVGGGRGMNTLFVDPVIKLLQTRSGG